MTETIMEDGQVQLIHGHVLDVLAELPEASVQAVITSPPYWSLRAYGTEPQVWGGDPGHEHEWNDTRHKRTTGVDNPGPKQSTNSGALTIKRGIAGNYCPCGAWRGELGHEPTPDLYVEHLVEVFRAVRRVLRPDGVCFVNLGDSYAGSGGYSPDSPSNIAGSKQSTNAGSVKRAAVPGLKPKSLCLIPERFALAMAADDWIVRSRIAWCKRAPMPESVRDRPTSAWEHIWLFSRQPSYFYDLEAVRERDAGYVSGNGFIGRQGGSERVGPLTGGVGSDHKHLSGMGANQRNYWLLSPDAEPAAHFATYPRELVRRCIAAGTSEHGQCPTCGKPWVRVVERTGGTIGKSWHNHEADLARGQRGGDSADGWKTYQRKDHGWQQACACPPAPPVPQIVLDPFVGSGTTCQVARAMGRRSIGIDLSETYLREIAARKNAQMGLLMVAEQVE